MKGAVLVDQQEPVAPTRTHELVSDVKTGGRFNCNGDEV